VKLILSSIRTSIQNAFSPLHWGARLVFWGSAILVGIVSALFALGSEHANELFQNQIASNPYLPLLITPAGLVLIAWLTRTFFPGAQGSGIPQAIAALQIDPEARQLRETLLSIRIAIGKVLLTLLGLLCGASIGREGPTVHIGAAIMYSIGHRAHFPRHYLDHGLILAGGAAGIAAAFNTPLAGIVFAIEEMARSFEEKTSGTLLTAVVLAGVTAMAILGNYTYFGSTSALLDSASQWVAIPVCGIIGGLIGGTFARLLVAGSYFVGPHLKRHPFLIPALCGLGVAISGLLSGGQVYGTGYAEAQMAITGSSDLEASYPFLKMFATLASYFSGIPGGIFAPSLATGAGLGAVVADFFAAPMGQAIVLLTMVAYFTGVVQTPITAFVIVMEMTDNHQMLLPLMAAAFIAYGVSKLINPTPIYRVLALAFLQHTTTVDDQLEDENSPDKGNKDDSQKNP
jgi:H+/Cl- antiporter ClcA